MGKLTDDQPTAPVVDETPATTGEVTDGASEATTTEMPAPATEAEFESEAAADAGLTTLGDI